MTSKTVSISREKIYRIKLASSSDTIVTCVVKPFTSEIRLMRSSVAISFMIAV